jgi:hypothetical protein
LRFVISLCTLKGVLTAIKNEEGRHAGGCSKPLAQQASLESAHVDDILQ